MKYGLPLALPVTTSTPVSVTTKVSSNCALSFPSTVTAVQSSGHCSSRQLPAFIMGSIVKLWPGFITPIALFSIFIVY